LSELKTKVNDASVQKFLEGVDNESKRKDCEEILTMMQEATGCEPKMWGASMIGFGSYHYKYDSGREGDFMLVGFAPRKSNISVYIIPGFSDYESELEKLGKHKTGKSCLYINKLEEVDKNVLQHLISDSVVRMRKKYPDST